MWAEVNTSRRSRKAEDTARWKDILNCPSKKREKEIISGKSLSQEMYKVTSRGPFQPNLLYDSMKS